MAMKILKFVRFQQEHVKGQRALLTVKFLDDESNLYSWAPRWADLDNALRRALHVEAFNKPESEWLDRLSNTVREASKGVSQPIQDAKKVNGYLLGYQRGMLQINCSEDGYNEYTETVAPGFTVTCDFSEKWLHRHIEALIINGVAVSVKDQQTGAKYPPKETPESEPEM